MPSRRAHLYVDKLLFGRTYLKVHQELDKAFKRLGRRHRAVGHDSVSALAAASKHYPGDLNAFAAAQYHIILDEQCSRDANFRRILEVTAMLEPGEPHGRRRR